MALVLMTFLEFWKAISSHDFSPTLGKEPAVQCLHVRNKWSAIKESRRFYLIDIWSPEVREHGWMVFF